MVRKSVVTIYLYILLSLIKGTQSLEKKIYLTTLQNILNKSCIECFFSDICYSCVFLVGSKFLGIWRKYIIYAYLPLQIGINNKNKFFNNFTYSHFNLFIFIYLNYYFFIFICFHIEI